MKRFRLALFTALASITIAEFTTGATALTAIITDPGVFFLFSIPSLFGLYGCGVILIREASIRWNRGWPTILALGIAYGIMEEGIAVHTFFDPVSITVGIFGQYGKFLTLNVTWAVLISLFHAVYSIALPILLGNILWPETRDQRLLTRRSGSIIIFLYLLTVLSLFIFVPYKPSLAWIIVLLAVVVALVVAGKNMNVNVFREETYRPGNGRTRLYLIGGFLYFPFIIVFSRYLTFLPSLLTDVILVLFAIILYRSFENRLPGNERRKLAILAVGLLVPLQLFGFVLNLFTNPLQIIAVVAVLYLEYRILKLTKTTGMIPGNAEIS